MTVKHKTRLINWRGGEVEFAHSGPPLSGCRREYLAAPPWYVLHLSGGTWSKKGWYYWIDYVGPPQVYLTLRLANIKAKELRKQYKCKVRVVKLDPDHDGHDQ